MNWARLFLTLCDENWCSLVQYLIIFNVNRTLKIITAFDTTKASERGGIWTDSVNLSSKSCLSSGGPQSDSISRWFEVMWIRASNFLKKFIPSKISNGRPFKTKESIEYIDLWISIGMFTAWSQTCMEMSANLTLILDDDFVTFTKFNLTMSFSL